MSMGGGLQVFDWQIVPLLLVLFKPLYLLALMCGKLVLPRSIL